MSPASLESTQQPRQPPQRRRRFIRALRRSPIRSAYRIFVGVLVVLYLGYIYASVLGPRRTLTSISANTESLQVEEEGGRPGQILLAPAWLSTDTDLKGHCLRGVFTPDAGATLILSRQGTSDLTAQIQPADNHQAGALVSSAGVTHRYSEAVTLSFGRSHSDCMAQSLVRIPIAGPTTVGVDYSAQSNVDEPALVLRSGHIDTFTRAADQFFGLHWKNSEGGLYPTGSANLPAGARLRECAPAAARVAWTGFAEVRPFGSEAIDRNIDLAAFTDAQRLSLTTPGGDKTGGVNCEGTVGTSPGSLALREDVLGVSLMSRLVSDPNLAGVSLVLGLILLVLQVIIAVHAIEEGKREEVAFDEGRTGP